MFFKDSVAIDDYIWYFDEIKLVVRGEIGGNNVGWCRNTKTSITH